MNERELEERAKELCWAARFHFLLTFHFHLFILFLCFSLPISFFLFFTWLPLGHFLHSFILIFILAECYDNTIKYMNGVCLLITYTDTDTHIHWHKWHQRDEKRTTNHTLNNIYKYKPNRFAPQHATWHGIHTERETEWNSDDDWKVWIKMENKRTFIVQCFGQNVLPIQWILCTAHMYMPVQLQSE